VSDYDSTFVCAYVLDGHGGGKAVDVADVDAWSPDQGLLWVHLDLLNPKAREWLDSREDIDALMTDALLAGETRPRAVPNDNGMLLVLRGVNMNPGSNPDDMVSIRVLIDGNRILTSRRRRLLSIQDIRDGIDAGSGPSTAGEFIVTLVERLADRIGLVVDQIEDAVGAAEENFLAADASTLRSRLSSLRRQTAAIRRYLAPQRDALDRLYRQPGPGFSHFEANELREQSDRITRYLEDLDLARERAILLQEELASRVASEQNARMYLLSVIAAIFLPLTFVTGLLGMNVAGLPGTENPAAFALSIVIMFGLGVVLVVFFRWKKWI